MAESQGGGANGERRTASS